LVPKAVAQVLGLQEDASTPVVQALCAHVVSRRLLLVLDNCEHLVEPCADLAAALLQAAPDVRVLASSREALNVAGEQTYPLPPLALPDPESSAVDAARSDAGRLFVERARLRQPAFALSERNVKVVAQICARLDGIPRALAC
jgi:predicted ATPase